MNPKRDSVKIRKVLLDNHLGIEDPRFYRKLDTKKIVEIWAKSHIDLAWIDFNDIFGHSYYNTKIGHKFAPLGERDQMAEMIDELRKHNIGVWASYILLWQGRHYGENPDWMQKGGDGQVSEYICPNSPAREFVLAQLKELVSGYDIDGIFLDMGLFWDNCHCEYCKKKFKYQFGIAIPTEPDWNSPSWRTFLKWRYDSLYNFIKEVVETIKGAKDIPVEAQWAADWIYGARFGQSIRVAELVDLIGHDIYECREGIIHYTLLPKFYRSIKGGEPYRYELCIGRMMGELTIWGNKPTTHLAAEIYTAIANGSSSVIIDQMHPEGYIEEEAYKPISEIYSEVEKREEWLLDIKSSSLHKYAAIYYSEVSRDFYGRGNMSKYVQSFQGACKALLECHLPFEIIVDRQMNLKDLSEYKVLVLPNTAILTEEQVSIIEQFVEQGGGLVATCETSLADEWGNLKKNFALSNLLHVKYLDRSSYGHNYLRRVKTHPVVDGLNTLPIQISVPEAGAIQISVPEAGAELGSPVLKVQSIDDAEIVAKITFPYSEPQGRKRVSHNNPPGVDTDFPAIVCSQHGKGKVAYFAYQPGAVYASSSYLEHKMLMANAVKWAAGERAPLEVKAPMSVEAIIWHQPDKDRFIVHLLNYVTDMGRVTKTPATPENPHIIEEILPVYDVKLRVMMGEYKVKAVHTVPDLQKLTYGKTDGHIEITVPKIDLWTMIAIQY